MNEMRKLMEAINTINEGGDVAAELALNELKAAMDAWHNAITKFQGIYDPSTVGLEGWIEGDHEVMFDLESELEDPMDEAFQGGKTEHSGAKHGKGAFYGRKKEAKRDSNKNRRRAGKEASLGEDIDPKTGDIRTYMRSDEEYMQDILKLVEEGLEEYNDIHPTYEESAHRMAQVLQDIDNITRLRANKRPYAPIHEAEYGDFESGEDAVYDYGVVRVQLRFNDREVTLTHGHGENIFLHMDEWNEFVGELKDT